MPDEPCRWKDLTIRDLLFVTFAVAVGFSLAVASRSSYQLGGSNEHSLLDAPTDTEVFLLGFVVGFQLTGPLIISSQFLLRGRRTFLNLREVLWLTPLVTYAVTIISVLVLGLHAEFLAALSLLVIFAAGCVASGLLLVRVIGIVASRRERAHWYWGDYLGCISCTITTCYVIWGFVAVLNTL